MLLDREKRLKILHASAVLQEQTGCSPLASLQVARLLSPAELETLWAARPAPTLREIATRLWLQVVSRLQADVSIHAALPAQPRSTPSRPNRPKRRAASQPGARARRLIGL